MPAQAGFLLWSGVQQRKWSSLGTLASIERDVARISELSDEFIGIAVSPELKTYMARRWREHLGYSEQSMFPDLDGFANAQGVGQPLAWDFFAD